MAVRRYILVFSVLAIAGLIIPLKVLYFRKDTLTVFSFQGNVNSMQVYVGKASIDETESFSNVTGRREKTKKHVNPMVHFYKKQPKVYTAVDRTIVPTTSNGGKIVASDDHANTAIDTTTAPTSTVTDDGKTNGDHGGVVLALDFYEQLTMSTGHLAHLQCWSRTLGPSMSVATPFVRHSLLTLPFDEDEHMLPLEDIIDIDMWQNHTAHEDGLSPLMGWDEFLASAPKDLIVVIIRYSSLGVTRVKGSPGSRPLGERYKTGCKQSGLNPVQQRFFDKNGFKTVRSVCVNYLESEDCPNLESFNSHILGEFDSSKVSIFIDEWRGLAEPQRINLINFTLCRGQENFRRYIFPSKKILRDADSYIQTYFPSGKFLSVIVRFEMTWITSKKTVEERIPYCTHLILHELSTLRRDLGINNTFLSVDIGKYGSNTFSKRNYYGGFENISHFLESVYGGTLKVGEWEKTFDGVSGIADSGYNGMLQKTIAMKASCVLFSGGGSYQRNGLQIYKRLHSRETEQCVHVVKECTSPYRPVE